MHGKRVLSISKLAKHGGNFKGNILAQAHTCLLLLSVKLSQCFSNLDFAFLLQLASWWLTRSNFFFYGVLLLQTYKKFWVQLIKLFVLEVSFQPVTGIRHLYPFNAECSFLADFLICLSNTISRVVWQRRVVSLWQFFMVALLWNNAWSVFIFVNWKQCDLIYLLLVFMFDMSSL